MGKKTCALLPKSYNAYFVLRNQRAEEEAVDSLYGEDTTYREVPLSKNEEKTFRKRA